MDTPEAKVDPNVTLDISVLKKNECTFKKEVKNKENSIRPLNKSESGTSRGDIKLFLKR